jgi:hypothetical protein
MLSLGLSFASRRFWLGNLESKLIYLDLTQMVSMYRPTYEFSQTFEPYAETCTSFYMS